MTHRLRIALPLFLSLTAACSGDLSGNGADAASGRDAGRTAADGSTTRDAADDGAVIDHDAAPTPDGGPIGPGQVAIVVAVGRGGRSTISCDDGHTWIENRIETAPTVRCWGQPDNAEPQFLDAAGTMPNPNYLECDHTTSNVTGLVYHRGAFYRSIGWGTPGRTQRSVDGVTWTEPSPGFDPTYTGLVSFDDMLVAMGTPQPYYSTDEGTSWPMTTATLGWDAGHVRAATRSSYGAMGSIVFVTDMGIWWTGDRGATFHGPSPMPCTGGALASGGAVTVLTGMDGTMCTTIDGGQTWQTQSLATSFATNPVWNGRAFHVWGDAASGFSHFTSADGVTWTTTSATNVRIAIAGATVSGAFVGIDGIWNGGYENQRFFRSDDGDTWETLPTDGSAFVAGHPISRFESGVVPANAYCPAR